MKRIILYNIVATFVLFSSMEITTRSLSWLSGNGFTLSLHEVDPSDKKIRDIYKWHPFVGVTFNPNTEFIGTHPNQKQKSAILVDQHGFLAKDNELKLAKESDEIRIATIGGSTTANISLTYDQNWPGYLGNLIQREFPNKRVRVINAGIPGFDTAQSIGNLALNVMPFEPDIVIIYHAYNDFKAIRRNIKFKSDYSHIHDKPYGFHNQPNLLTRILSNSMLYIRTCNLIREYKMKKLFDFSRTNNKMRLSTIPNEAESTFEEHIRILVAIAKSGGASVILSSFATLYDPNLNWDSPRDTIKKLSEFQKVNIGGLYYFTPGLTIPAIFDGFKRYNKILHDVAIQEKVDWVDNGNIVPHKDQYFVDWVHFSTLGAKLMGENFVPHVKKILTEVAS